MTYLKSILFSAVITGFSVTNLQSTFAPNPYLQGENSKNFYDGVAAKRTHNIAHQVFPKMTTALSRAEEEQLQQQKLKEQEEERIKDEIRLGKIKFAANFFTNYMQNWYELCIFITNMPQNISKESFFKEAEKILNNKRIDLYQPNYPQDVFEDDNRIIYFVQVINDKISFLDNAIKDYKSNCEAHKVTTSAKYYLLQLTVGYIKYIMLSKGKQSDVLSIYNFLDHHQDLIDPIFKNNFKKFLSFLKDIENCDMSHESINYIINNYHQN